MAKLEIGKIDKVHMWNAVLTDEEMAALASGVALWLIRPDKYVWPCLSEVEEPEMQEVDDG